MEDPVMNDPQVKEDQAKLAADIEAAKLRAAGVPANVPAAAPVAIGGDPNVPQNAQAPAAAPAPAEPVAMTVEEVEAKRNEENLQRAIANGYKEPEQPTAKDRVMAVLDSMEHQIQHNGPITLEMIRELRDVLGLPATPAPASEG